MLEEHTSFDGGAKVRAGLPCHPCDPWPASCALCALRSLSDEVAPQRASDARAKADMIAPSSASPLRDRMRTCTPWRHGTDSAGGG